MRKRSIIVVVALAGLIAIVIEATMLTRRDKETTVVTRDNVGPVSDDEAVRLSREALRRAVKDFADYRPQPYNGTNIFAINIYNSNAGYVLWAHTARTGEGFSVAMEIKGSNVVCEVTPFK